jgi:2-methylcitrate dehydratase PrpD
MVAVPLLLGRLTADDYEDQVAKDSRIDALRAKMIVRENAQFSADYLDPEKRAIGNSIQIFFADGSSTERAVVEYPIGHRRRRAEGIPKLLEKFSSNLATQFDPEQCAEIESACRDAARLEAMPVNEFTDLWVR